MDSLSNNPDASAAVSSPQVGLVYELEDSTLIRELDSCARPFLQSPRAHLVHD
jgi:hypothetical protein